MTASTISSPATGRVQHISLQEWLKLRRYPRPEFFSSLKEIPQTLRDIAQPWLPPDCPVQGVLLLPGEYYARKKIHWEWVPERALIFLNGAALHVTGETEDDSPKAMLLDAQTLLYLRSSLLLLYGLLEFRADCGGQVSEVRIEYNTVIWHSLKGPLARFVAAASPHALSIRDEEVKARNASMIETLPFKFANGVRYYVLDPGELLQTVVFQPAIWERRGILPTQVTPNTLFALTDRKLVLIEESRSSFWRSRRSNTEYGWIFTYIPRDRVLDMVLTAGARWTELRLSLQWGSARDERAFLLEPSIASSWKQALLSAQES